VFVNGFTDAPNAIVNCVATGCLSLKKAALMSAVFNLAGTAAGFLLTKKVAATISGLVSLSSPAKTTIAVAATLLAVIIWSVGAWRFGIPTSESHSLAAGLAGAAFALGGASLRAFAWLKVFLGLFVSVTLSFLLGALINRVFSRFKLREKTYRRLQITAAAAMSFMHGAQDGQKFLGLYFIVSVSASVSPNGDSFIPPVLTGLLMALGTAFGGGRIIEHIGKKMVKIKSRQGFYSDLASAVSLFVCTIWGLPVSTTHTKTTAIMGAGREKIDKNTAYGIILAWVLTFPCCFVLSYAIAFIIKGLRWA